MKSDLGTLSPSSANEFTASAPLSACQFLNRRLLSMFQRIPEIMAGGTLETKLHHAAEALTEQHFFDACVLHFADEDSCIAIRSGAETTALDLSEDKCRQLLLQFQPEILYLPLPELDEASSNVIAMPMRNHSGQTVGVAILRYSDQSLATEDLLKLVNIFLMETTQSAEQFKLEHELEEKENRYRSLLDNVSDTIFQVDLQGKIMFVSRHVEDILGMPWRAIRYRNFFDFVAPAALERAQDALNIVGNGKSVSLDLILQRPDNGSIIVSVTINAIHENGAVIGGLGVARDVTEKRRLEEQIQESERRYRALTENAYDAIFLADPETCGLVDVNPQAEKLTGYSRAELLRMSLYDLRRPHQHGDLRRRVEGVMQSGTGRYDDTTMLCKDGREISVDISASVYEIDKKRFYQTIVRDNSLQRSMHEAMNERIMELEILSAVSDAMQSAVDLQSVMGIVLTGVTAGEGLGFNRAFILSYDRENKELHGEAELGPRSPEEAGRIWSELASKGLSLPDILAERIRSFPRESEMMSDFVRHAVISLDDERNVFARAIRDREARRVNRREENPFLPDEFAGLYHADEFAIVPLVTRDDIIGALLVDNMFTHRSILDEDLHRLKLFANAAASAIERSRLLVKLERRLHELTLAYQDLKESRDRLVRSERLSAIGEVAANVAHEIRNPLTAIGGFARSVYSSLEESDKNRRKIKIVLEETDRLERMLTDLLVFTRPVLPVLAEVDLNQLVTDTLTFMIGEMDLTKVDIAYNLNENLPAVWGDAHLLRQVLLNIIRNALHEMPDGGRISFTSNVANNEVGLFIQDSGPGIPPEILDKIFDAFFTTRSTGSGLGLAICAQIMRNHNGRLEAVSRQGEGATFVVTLPCAEKSLAS
jgi:PAS domain S-box-containing protein